MKVVHLKMFFAVIVVTSLCCTLFQSNVYANSQLVGKTLTVFASHYGGRDGGKRDGFNGKTTANCTKFDATAKTVAHKTLRFGTRAILTNPENGCSVLVTVTDRGPYVDGRDLDVASYGVGKVLEVANKTKLKMRIVFVPKEPIMGNACR